jgi:hypothetical protein
MRAVLAALLAGLLVSAGATHRTPTANSADALVFGGLGTWVDIYDSAVYAAPERTAARIAARGVETVWVETANYRAAADVVNPVRLGRLVDALHANGVRVVGWYLPGHVKPALDNRRALALLQFRSASGQSFDGVALDVEATKLRSVGLRSRRAVALARSVGSSPRSSRSRSFPSTREAWNAIRAHGLRSRGQSWPRRRTPSRRWSTRAAR